MPGFGQKTQTITTDDQIDEQIRRKKELLNQISNRINEVETQKKQAESLMVDIAEESAHKKVLQSELKKLRANKKKVTTELEAVKGELLEVSAKLSNKRALDELVRKTIEGHEAKIEQIKSIGKECEQKTILAKAELKKAEESLEKTQSLLEKTKTELNRIEIEREESKEIEKKTKEALRENKTAREQLETTKNSLKALKNAEKAAAQSITSAEDLKKQILDQAHAEGEDILLSYRERVASEKKQLEEREGLVTRKDKLLEEKRRELIRFKVELEKHLGKPITSIKL